MKSVMGAYMVGQHGSRPERPGFNMLGDDVMMTLFCLGDHLIRVVRDLVAGLLLMLLMLRCRPCRLEVTA